MCFKYIKMDLRGPQKLRNEQMYPREAEKVLERQRID
jgi:hypothetical protein